MTRHTVTLTWDDQSGITKLQSSPDKAPVEKGDTVSFVAAPAGTPLVVFPDGSPFLTADSRKPHWILGSDAQTVKRITPGEPSTKFKFLCAVIDGTKVHGGIGGDTPPIRPAK